MASTTASTAKPAIHVCEDCQTSFTSRNQLFLHIRSTHTDSHTSLPVSTIQYDLTEYQEVSVLYEDETTRIIVKPQGLPTMGRKDMVTLMTHPSLRVEENFKFGLARSVGYRKAIPCHRLDSATGGIVVCSKNKESESCIRMCFRHKLVHKRYRAIIAGQLPQLEGMIDTKINHKQALTKYKVISVTRSKQYDWLTTVDLWPVTGRKHQLRRHIHSLGSFIIGDHRYSPTLLWPHGITHLFLWSVELGFPHPDELKRFMQTKDGDTIRLLDKFDNGDADSDEEDDHDADTEAKHKDKKARPSNTEEGEQMITTEEEATAFRAKIKALVAPLQQVHVSIQEPKYYQQFCRRHEEEYRVACQEASAKGENAV